MRCASYGHYPQWDITTEPDNHSASLQSYPAVLALLSAREETIVVAAVIVAV